ncbi:NAD-dependent epimerase/dehydratase family protein [Anaerosinus gibii]|uniref:GDP-mannose 4,6-dehydratase n=1 Tax=Selenobaculum gibii TaxID=3054208 RepID=A0A9Y2ERE6_9FIRM|nr:NAD-dependent epimerase/dehydratase family protein [Selenobaculum gbiensis]WIW71102.1 GDP-mannose 4,6-dehydratase [Selenobaculum gbiensis]
MKKILITGGAGFIGSHIIELLQKENCDITVLDNLHTGLRENVPENVRLIEMDIRDKRVIDVFEKYQFDVVLHLAGQTMVNVSVDDPFYDADVNIMGTVNILEACRKTGVKRIVFSSTAATYGDIEEVPIREEFSVNPLSFYGLSKLTVEKYLKLYHDLYGLEYVILRYANVYGERQGDGGEGGVISIFTKKIAKDESFVIHGDGKQTRDFVYAGDVARANWYAANTEYCNTIYNVSTNSETSIRELVDLLESASGKTIDRQYGERREGDIYRSVLDNSKIVTNLNWRPMINLQEGLRRTYDYFVKSK